MMLSFTTSLQAPVPAIAHEPLPPLVLFIQAVIFVGKALPDVSDVQMGHLYCTFPLQEKAQLLLLQVLLCSLKPDFSCWMWLLLFL